MPPMQGWQYQMPRQVAPRKSGALRVLLWVLVLLVLGGSILMNVALLRTLGSAVDSRGGLIRQHIERGSSSQTVAVYSVSGIIDGSAANEFTHFFNAVIDDNDVKAVVLRVESPGGGVTASDQIWNMVREIKSSGKVVVVSMGAMAASGGYYISAPADEIIAEETTLTGSIGVITGWFVFKGTLEKIGAQSFTIKSTNAQIWKDEMSPTATPQDYQIEHLQTILDEMQAKFEKVVREGRVDGNGRPKINPHTEEVTTTDKDGKTVTRKSIEPFNGKIYMPERAQKLGLIDGVGYQRDAIDRAKTLASLSNANVVKYQRRKSFMESLLDGKSQQAPLTIDANLLDQLQTPKFMMLWKVE
jgi:protease-4